MVFTPYPCMMYDLTLNVNILLREFDRGGNHERKFEIFFPQTERLMNDSGKGGFLSNFLNFSPRERERVPCVIHALSI